jgi:hypothetical protein
MIKGIFSSEILVNFQRTTRRYIPEDRILHSDFKFSLHAGFISNNSKDFTPVMPKQKKKGERNNFKVIGTIPVGVIF